jgi:hypothetical protein
MKILFATERKKAMNSEQKAISKLIRIIEEFEPFRDGRDERWVFFLKEKRRWRRLCVVKYDGTYYFSGSDFDAFSYPSQKGGDIGPDEHFSVWLREISRWRRSVAHDPIEAQARLFRQLPLGCRKVKRPFSKRQYVVGVVCYAFNIHGRVKIVK